MPFTQFTSLDFDEIKASIKDYIRANTTFTDYDYEGSNLSVLINILAYNTYLTAYNSNMVANEVFLDTATLRENVVALAKKRLIEFQHIAEDLKNSYRKKLINKTVNVLFENKMKSGNRYFGRDEHFNSVIVESDDNLAGKIKNVKITNGNQNTLYGEIILNLRQTNCAA